MKRFDSVVAATASGLAMACTLALSGCGGSASPSAAPAPSGKTHTSGKVSCPAVSEINTMLAIHDKGPSKLKVSGGSILCLYSAVSGKGSANVVINSHYTKAGFASAKAQFATQKTGHLSNLSGLGDEAVSFVTNSISVDAIQGSLFVHAAANSTTLARVESLVRHVLQAS
jgi:hypothetical protein